jgi:LmbE family N-acetylglucosaminyl deacetylase
MPLVLRSNGGLGTHWMFPANVTLRTPFGIEGEDEFSLEGDAVKKIVADLHRLQPNNLNIDDPDVEKAWDWICKDGHADHRKTWERLVRSLGSTGKIYDCPKMEPTQK